MELCWRAKYAQKRTSRALHARFMEKRYVTALFWLQKWIQRPQISLKPFLSQIPGTLFSESDLLDSVIAKLDDGLYNRAVFTIARDKHMLKAPTHLGPPHLELYTSF